MSNYKNQLQHQDRFGKPVDSIARTASEVLTSSNPAKWVAGIAIGTIAVAGLAIKAISELDNGR
ncbi:MAG: hypothetical protein MJY72_04135 [Bacteroidales bacterium]|nr:hypothetical protein [Bacteroidales bacterium]